MRSAKDKEPLQSIMVEKEFKIKVNHKVGMEIEVQRSGGNAIIDFTCRELGKI